MSNDPSTRNLPALLAAQKPVAKAPAFDAQILGQGGQKRGLRGGKPVLKSARAAYLEAEWSGPDDRRLAAGRIMKVEI